MICFIKIGRDGKPKILDCGLESFSGVDVIELFTRTRTEWRAVISGQRVAELAAEDDNFDPLVAESCRFDRAGSRSRAVRE